MQFQWLEQQFNWELVAAAIARVAALCKTSGFRTIRLRTSQVELKKLQQVEFKQLIVMANVDNCNCNCCWSKCVNLPRKRETLQRMNETKCYVIVVVENEIISR